MTLHKKRSFVLFITHAFRLLLICQAVDKTILDADMNPKTLKQVLRKYSTYEAAFPENKWLIESLQGDVLWFSHSSTAQCCNIAKFYKQEMTMRVCSNCIRMDTDLKVCSRCRVAYYCNAVCQKNDYPKHKKTCVVPKVEGSGQTAQE